MKKEHEKDTAPEELDNDVDFEPEEELGDIASAKAKLAKLKAELAAAKKERQEFLDGWQRCKADSVNARREALASAERISERAKDGLVLELIPVLDSFDMATGSEAWEAVDPTWKSGMEHIRNQLLDVLQGNGITRFGKIGEQFDPKKHEAIQETDEMPGLPHSIVKIIRFGYAAGDRIIRPAQVIVKAA